MVLSPTCEYAARICVFPNSVCITNWSPSHFALPIIAPGKPFPTVTVVYASFFGSHVSTSCPISLSSVLSASKSAMIENPPGPKCALYHPVCFAPFPVIGDFKYSPSIVQSPTKKFSRCISGPGCGACIAGGLAGFSVEDCCAPKLIPIIATNRTNHSFLPALRMSKFLLANLPNSGFPQSNRICRRILNPRECSSGNRHRRQQHFASQLGRLVDISLDVVHFHIKNLVVLRLWPQLRDISRRALARVNHRGRSGLGDLPIKHFCVETLRRLAVLAANFEMHHGIRHARSPIASKFSSSVPPTAFPAASRAPGAIHTSKTTAALQKLRPPLQSSATPKHCSAIQPSRRIRAAAL